MIQEPKPGRRIVSWGAFAVAVAKRMRFNLLAALIGLGGFTGLLGVTLVLLKGIAPGGGHVPETLLHFVGPCALLGAASFLWLRRAKNSMIQAIREGDVLPLTRANTADLPANDTLGRASSEPIQEQGAVLLRAVTETQETSPEQLLRAVNGQE